LDTILDYMGHWAAVQPEKCFGMFLDRHGKPRETYTYQSFEARTRFLAEYIHDETALQRGDRAALVYPPGLEMVASFLACARIGVIPVPVPPVGSVAKGGAARLTSVMLDSGAALALTDSSLGSAPRGTGEVGDHADSEDPFAPLGIKWLATDLLQGAARGDIIDNPAETLFLQYTSGSTGAPKGVVVSHQNVIHTIFSRPSPAARHMEFRRSTSCGGPLCGWRRSAGTRRPTPHLRISASNTASLLSGFRTIC